MEIRFDISDLVTVIIEKTLKFSGVEKTEQEIKEFRSNLISNKDFIEAIEKVLP